jgi:DNA primase
MTKDRLLQINKECMLFFKGNLTNYPKIQKYLYSRIPKILSDKMCIGFANDSFSDFVRENEYEKDELDALGLIYEDGNGDIYSVFNDRLIIPIFTSFGIVGFSGRALKNQRQKYINTKKTILYSKSEILYPLDIVKQYIYAKNCCIIVEGQFDALALLANGIKNVVAICGSSMSKYQVNLIKRWANRAKILLDGDAAGKLASEKIKNLLVENNVKTDIISLSDGYDPDVFIREYGIGVLTKQLL